LEDTLSPRTRTTYSKRQKEQARQEKQRAKAQRKLQRKMESQAGTAPEDSGAESLASENPEAESPEHSEQASPALE
jgi:hypothetical protein